MLDKLNKLSGSHGEIRPGPAEYGVLGSYVPKGLWRPLLFPFFTWKGS